MSLAWPEDEPWQQLRSAVEPGVEALLADVQLVIEPGDVDGPLMQLTDGGLRLSPALLGPEMRHIDDEHWLYDDQLVFVNLNPYI